MDFLISSLNGQMYPKEREFLYDAVIERRPRVSFEVGTWKGGGSTLQIVHAIHTLVKDGYLVNPIMYTCEVCQEYHFEALDAYANTDYWGYLNFNNIDSTSCIKTLLKSKILPDFIMFDGPEDPDLNLNDFKLLDRHVAVGTYFCMHDWDLGVRVDGLKSVKADLLRPYLENNSSWEIIRSLTAPDSVGIVLAKKIS